MNGLMPLAVLDDAGALSAQGTHIRKRIEVLEDYLCTLPSVDITLKHYFGLNTYAREMLIPKDTILTGSIHKTQHIIILSKGDMSIMTPAGMIRIKAPYTAVGTPGTKRVLYTHEDCVLTTIMNTPLKDPAEIIERVTALTDDEYQQWLLEQPPTVECPMLDSGPIVEPWKPRLLKPRGTAEKLGVQS